MGELVTLKEARERVGLSKNTLRGVIDRHKIPYYENPRDRRQTLVDIEQVESALRPVPMKRDSSETGKAAA